MSVVTWAYRLILFALIAFVLVSYGQTSSGTGAATGGSYAEGLQQALAGLKELAGALQ
jgi:hypothetical protein